MTLFEVEKLYLHEQLKLRFHKIMNITMLKYIPTVRIFLNFLFLFCSLWAIGQDIRSIDGIGNNIDNPQVGAKGDVQVRLTPPYYLDGIGEPVVTVENGKPNPREISNRLFDQDDLLNDRLNLSDFAWVFGQFIDHDITLTENSEETMFNIVVPSDDEVFAPNSVMPMSRHEYVEGTGVGEDNPRVYPNNITAYIDGSTVYGSDEETASWLRQYSDGKLKVSDHNNLPWNTNSLSINGNVDTEAPEMADDTRSLTKYFVAGDIRANENPLLIAMHTLFVREHNRQCESIKIKHPGYNDERIYQAARKRVIAIIQNIVYNEWLPALGLEIPEYTGYKSNVEARIFNEFSAAAFRFGHTLINSNIIRMDNDGDELPSGNIELRDAFFNPTIVNFAGGIDPYIKGMATQIQQDFDCKIIDDVRNFLFSSESQIGLDLAAININRGRDRGLADFNTIRTHLGLPMYSEFVELTNSVEDAEIIGQVYEDIGNLDAWVGMLAEKRQEGKLFGRVVSTIVQRQFQVLRDGDRFYFENDQFDDEELEEIKSITMRDVIMNNTDIKLMQENVFTAMPHQDIEEGPKLVPFDLEAVVFPNPVSTILNIKVYSDTEKDATVTLLDYQGKKILSENYSLYKGSNFINISLENCPRGFYNALIETDRKYKILKVVKE